MKFDLMNRAVTRYAALAVATLLAFSAAPAGAAQQSDGVAEHKDVDQVREINLLLSDIKADIEDHRHSRVIASLAKATELIEALTSKGRVDTSALKSATERLRTLAWETQESFERKRAN